MNDPSYTKTARETFSQRLRGGYSRISARYRDAGTELFGNDVPDLREMPPEQQKEEFRQWLEQKQRDEVGSIVEPEYIPFILTAYKQGLSHANTQLKRNGVAEPTEPDALLDLDRYGDQLGRLYDRNVEAVEKMMGAVTGASMKEFSDIMLAGIGTVGIVEARKRLIKPIETVGFKRSTALGHSEVIKAHSTGTLDRFQASGVEEVTAEVEFTTAGDNRVCPTCAGLGGTRYTIKEARGIIPVHPRCRCVWVIA